MQHLWHRSILCLFALLVGWSCDAPRAALARPPVSYGLTISDESAEQDHGKDLTVTYTIDRAVGVKVTYHKLKAFTAKADGRTRSVTMASKVTVTLTNKADDILGEFRPMRPTIPSASILKDGKRKDDNRPPLFAKMFGSRDDPRNVVLLTTSANLRQMKEIEETLLAQSKKLAAGAEINVAVTPEYDEARISKELERAAKADDRPDSRAIVPKSVAISSRSEFLSANDPVSKSKKSAILDNEPTAKQKPAAGLESALRNLTKILPPPAKPTDHGSAPQWQAAEKQLGSAFPEEYKGFVGRYGLVSVNRYLLFFTPFSDNEHAGLQPNLDRFRKGQAFSAELKLKSHPVWPKQGGLLPIASTVNAHTLAYRTAGKPNEWTVAVVSREGEVEEHPFGLVEFLTRLAEGTLESRQLLETGDLHKPRSVR